jgi:hypothetical protein
LGRGKKDVEAREARWDEWQGSQTEAGGGLGRGRAERGRMGLGMTFVPPKELKKGFQQRGEQTFPGADVLQQGG